MSEFGKTPEEQRQERLQQIDSELDQLTTVQNEASDREDHDKVNEIQAIITQKKIERFSLMTDKERVSMFESKLDDHREIAEMGLPVSIETIAEDSWGQMPDSLSAQLQSEVERIQEENDFIEREE